MTRVVHCRRERFDVYIGRPGLFGNPFTVEAFGRDRAIRLYVYYFEARMDMDPYFRGEVEKHRGKTLGCWCDVPKEACHGIIIAAHLDREDPFKLC